MNKKQAKNISHLRTRMSLLLLIVIGMLSVANAQSVIGSKHKLLPSNQANSNKLN